MIHGLLLCNKQPGMTSHDVVDRVRKIFHTRRVGHFGTLDPAASGLLMIGLGHVTKFFDFYQKKNKEYSGLIRFGFATTTYDAEGQPLGEPQAVDLHAVDIPALLAGFVGRQSQLPPVYSAKKVKGRPLYDYARRNEEIEVKPQEVEIFRLEGRVVSADTLWFYTAVTSGTYIRSLAHDIGRTVGCGAHLAELTRERIGEFRVQQAFTLEEIAAHVQRDELPMVVQPIETLLAEFPKLILTAGGCRAAVNGTPIGAADILTVEQGPDREFFRLFDDSGRFLAVAQKDPSRLIFKPYIVFPQ